MKRPYELDILSDEEIGHGGFLHLRRLRLQNLRPDGSRSEEWVCDFVERKKGVDAVVLVLWRDGAAGPEVLLRDGLRPALTHGRDPRRVPIPDERDRSLFTEVVAGIIEQGEIGEAAVRARAADEAWEEAGVRVEPRSIVLLGSSFPSPGLTAERFYFAAARVDGGAEAEAPVPPGDGTPMEEGASVRWVSLREAIAECVAGEIEDAKTELILRRLSDRILG